MIQGAIRTTREHRSTNRVHIDPLTERALPHFAQTGSDKWGNPQGTSH